MKSDFGDEYMPKRATRGSAGYDFYSPEEYELKPGEWTTIDTGIRFDGTEGVHYSYMHRPLPNSGVHTMVVEYPSQWFMMIVPRSGLSFKYGLRIINTVAIIDRDYRNTIKLKITVDEPYTLKKGERFAQGIFTQWYRYNDEIQPERKREGGFGSTGE